MDMKTHLLALQPFLNPLPPEDVHILYQSGEIIAMIYEEKDNTNHTL